MPVRQGQKFSKETQLAKKNIRLLRLAAGIKVNEGARLLGVSRKQLEDIETTRNYGCYLSLDLLVKVSQQYGVSVEFLLNENTK